MWLWFRVTAFFHTWYGTVAGTLGILATIFNGIPLMFRTRDFLVERFLDQPVLGLLRDEAMVPASASALPLQGYGVNELAKKLKRTPASIHYSIKRLMRTGKIEYLKGGFRWKE
jgi:hypothetical protein